MPPPPTRPLPATDSAELTALAGARRILFISNGHGEDSIAAEIIRRLPRGTIAEAYPTLGAGSALAEVCRIVGPRADLASQGWRNVKGSLGQDVAGGGLGTVWPGIKFIRDSARHYDRVVVVGDMVGIIGAFVAGIGNLVYLDVYKTGYGRAYWPLERWLIGRTSRIVFNRSEALAQSLRDRGIDARFAGNVMMDTISQGDYDARARRHAPRAVTLLPGSRQFTAESFALQVAALRLLPDDVQPDLFVAVAGSVDPAALGGVAGLTYRGPMSHEAGDLGTLSDEHMVLHLARGAAGNLIAASDLVLSQAGTATIQALGLGRPAITFHQKRDRKSRFRDETALFGDARWVVAPQARAVGEALLTLLTDDAERQRRAEIGRARVGGPGAIDAIIAEIIA